MKISLQNLSRKVSKIKIVRNCTPNCVQLSFNIRPTEEKVAAISAKVENASNLNGYEHKEFSSNASKNAETTLNDATTGQETNLNGDQHADEQGLTQGTFNHFMQNALPQIENNITYTDKRINVLRRTLKLLDEILEQTPDSAYQNISTLIGIFLLHQKLTAVYGFLIEEPSNCEIQHIIENISSRLCTWSERIDKLFIDPNIDPMGFDLIQKLRHLFAIGGWNTEKDAQSKSTETSDSVEPDSSNPVTRKRPLCQPSEKIEENVQIKYRRVDNTFPKFMPNDADDYNFKSMAEKCRLSTRNKSESNGEPQSYNPFPTQARRSIFEAPQRTQLRVRNTNIAPIIDLSDDEINDEPVFNSRTGALIKSPERGDYMNVRSPLVFSDPLRQHVNGFTADVVNYARPSSSLSSAVEARLNGHATNWYEMATENVVMHEEQRGERKQYLHLINNLSLCDGRPLVQSPPQRQLKKPEAPPPLHCVTHNGDEWLRCLIKHKPQQHENINSSLTEFNKLIEQNTGTQPQAKSQAIKTTPPQVPCISVPSDSSDVDASISLSSCSSSSNLTTSSSSPDMAKAPDIGKARHVPEIIDLDDSESEDKNFIRCLEDNSRRQALKPPVLVQTIAQQQRIQTSSYYAKDYETKSSKKHERIRKEKYRIRDIAKIEADKTTELRRANEQDICESLSKLRIIHKPIFVLDTISTESETEVEFVPLSEEHLQRYKELVHGRGSQVLISKFSLNITRNDISTLVGNRWLNDEVINFYMNLLTDRSERKSDKLPSVYAMNTFFVPRLLQNGHDAVRRWTRKVDLFNKDIIPVPVHVDGVHWCMAIIHMKNKTLRYYDSLRKPNQPVLDALAQYLCDESMDKRKQPFDTSEFRIENVSNVPHQMNGSDCGVFSCMFAEYITRNKPLTFTQEHMEYFRKKMVLEICSGELWM